MRNQYKLKQILWISLFFLLVFTPIGVLIAGPAPSSSRSVWLDFSVGLGFVGLALMAVQFALTARIKWLKEPFGSDLIYHFHRQISIAAFFLILAHPISLFILDARYLRLLNIFSAPWRARAGVFSVILLILVVISSEYRKKMKIPYDLWKFWHGILTTLVVATALLHIFLVGNYVSLPLTRMIWIVYSVSFIALLSYTRIIYPLKLMRNPYEVIALNEERGDSWTIRLRSTKGRSLPFQPGQFAWITAWKTPFSDSEHPFSISSSAERPEEIALTIKDLGKFTSTIKQMQPGQKIYVDGAHGSFSIDRYPAAQKLVFIAGGIGITPIMSMLRSMADRGDKRPVKLFYNNRDWDSVTFREEIAAIEKKIDLQVIYTLEIPPQAWDGEQGYLTEDIIRKYLPLNWIGQQTEIFMCGPQIMMEIVERQCQNLGFNDKHIHYELFNFV
ncbi:MAG TPA: oxidoreductase [Anaerolineaceae bacterium]|nr:oxidoreductase [Anaerolineaceae bacterium]